MRVESLGDRMKGYEAVYDFKLLPNSFIVARLDGRAFSNFTRKMKFRKPFDEIYLNAMRKTTKQIMKSTHALVGYTQSDEVTLILSPRRERFSNRIQKLCSTLASEFSVRFANNLASGLINQKPFSLSDCLKAGDIGKFVPHFDCRVYSVLSAQEAINSLIFREQDAVKNSILSLAQFYFSHNQIQNLNAKQLIEKLQSEKQVNWNDLDIELKRGCYLVPALVQSEISDEVWNKIPDNKKPESRLVMRKEIQSDKSFLRLTELADPIQYFGLNDE